MKATTKLWMILVMTAMLGLSACQKNYYSGKSKSKDCNCPNTKGMVGY